MTLGVVTCSRVEADCLAALSGVAVVASQGDPTNARRGLEELRRQGISGLVSFGIGAGLGPAMRPGDLVIADRVVLPSGTGVPTDAAWRHDLLQRVGGIGPRVVIAGAAGVDAAPRSVDEKLRIFRSTCAALLDGESHLAAETARAAALPLLVVRAVAEPAWDDHLAVPNRGLGSLSLVLRLATRPLDAPDTLRFAHHARRALETLQRVASLVPEPRLPVAA